MSCSACRTGRGATDGWFTVNGVPERQPSYNEKRETDVISQHLREQQIREEAADWAVRLSQGDPDPATAEALARWRQADPRHPEALAFAQATWDALGQLADEPAAGEPPRRRAAREAARPAPRTRRRWRWASGVAALLLVAVLGVDAGRPLLMPLLADYASGTGEVRRVTLPDGSEVELDSRSAIDVLYSDGERRVRLLAGEACFSVAPMGGDERRPFVVESAGGTTRALGTRFLVGERGQGAWVGVLEHSVAVNLEGVPGERVLSEGQSARYDRTQGIQPLLGLDLQRASSWRRGVLVFDRVPLAEVAEQLNRYRTRRLVVTDARLARREVSGVFRLDILDEALDTLTHELHAQRLDVPGATFLY